MHENPYKELREDFEFLPNGYKLTQEKLAKEFQDKTKPYYCDTLKFEAIRKIETDKRNVSENEMKAYRLRFNTTADYLHGFTTVKYRNSEDIETIENITGLSNDAIEMLKLWNNKDIKYPKLHKRCIDVINLILSDYYKEVQKSGENNIYFGNIFYDMWEYIHSKNTVVYDRNDETGELEGKTFINIAIGDDLDCSINNYESFSHTVGLGDATKSRTQNSIIRRLNELETKIQQSNKSK